MTAVFIVAALVLAILSKKIGLKYSSSLQILFIGSALIMISFNTISQFYRVSCIIIGMYNIITSIIKLIARKNAIDK